MKEFIKEVHYYLDGDRVVFTEKYHIERGYCCGSKKDGCRHCPYEPKGERGNTKIKENSDQ
jgi:hypothetical protein